MLERIARALVEDDGDGRLGIKSLDFPDQGHEQDDIPQITGAHDSHGKGHGLSPPP
jgi:hypothetical protein